jgi:hypothetical protein
MDQAGAIELSWGNVQTVLLHSNVNSNDNTLFFVPGFMKKLSFT